MDGKARPDARRLAASLVEHLQPSPLSGTAYCYGTPENVLVGIGRESSLVLSKARTFDSIWKQIGEFLDTHRGEFIGGFVGFDPANTLNSKVSSDRQKIDLFVPEQVYECSQSGIRVRKGDLDVRNMDLKPSEIGPKRIDIEDLDLSSLGQEYAEAISHFIEEIQFGRLERATLARKVESVRAFRLLATFMSDHSSHAVARSFYFSNEEIAFAGQCAEVLAEGTKSRFSTHKLSGTYAKHAGEPFDQLKTRFKTDERIIAEHRSAITSVEQSLSQIGSVRGAKFDVMELPTLIHGWTRFVTCPDRQVPIAACLRAVFPFGAYPVEPGFDLLAQHERFCRGPYYGVMGMIQPDGQFSFTQILRSAFTDQKGSYLMVGAAVTSRSTVELETMESRAKLSSIHVYSASSNDSAKRQRR
jgi:anthranilate/para-aminobenzoate synthase component I